MEDPRGNRNKESGVCKDDDKGLESDRSIVHRGCSRPGAKVVNERVVCDFGKRVMEIENRRDSRVGYEVANGDYYARAA